MPAASVPFYRILRVSPSKPVAGGPQRVLAYVDVAVRLDELSAPIEMETSRKLDNGSYKNYEAGTITCGSGHCTVILKGCTLAIAEKTSEPYIRHSCARLDWSFQTKCGAEALAMMDRGGDRPETEPEAVAETSRLNGSARGGRQ